jgi:hypothetical protein
MFIHTLLIASAVELVHSEGVKYFILHPPLFQWEAFLAVATAHM